MRACVALGGSVGLISNLLNVLMSCLCVPSTEKLSSRGERGVHVEAISPSFSLISCVGSGRGGRSVPEKPAGQTHAKPPGLLRHTLS